MEAPSHRRSLRPRDLVTYTGAADSPHSLGTTPVNSHQPGGKAAQEVSLAESLRQQQELMSPTPVANQALVPAPEMKELRSEIGGMKTELAMLEREQHLSNERQLAATRRKLREKKKSEIARRLIEAKRLQLVQQRKQEEEEEKRKKVVAFKSDMTARAEKHLNDAQDHHSRLWKVLGLRRLAPLGDEESDSGVEGLGSNDDMMEDVGLLGDHDRQMNAGQRPTSQNATINNGEQLLRTVTSNLGPSSTAAQVGEPTNPLLEAQLVWMREHVRHAAKNARQREEELAHAAEMRRNAAEAEEQAAKAHADGPLGLITHRSETIPELLAAQAKLRELGEIPTESDQIAEEKRLKEERKKQLLAQPFLIREGGQYTTLDAKVNQSLKSLEGKEAERAKAEEYQTAGERSALGDQCMSNGMVLEDTAEKNQTKRRFGTSNPLPPTVLMSPTSPLMSFGRGRSGTMSPGPDSPRRRVQLMELSVSQNFSPRATGIFSPGGRGWRPEYSEQEQKIQDRAALTQAQQQERFVTQLRNQRAAVLTYKEKLAQLEKENRAALGEPEPEPVGGETSSRRQAGHNNSSEARELFPTVDAEGDNDVEVSSRATTTAAIAQEQELAAKSIQQAFRIKSTREAIKEKRRIVQSTRQREAATAIQSVWRMSNCTKQLEVRKAEHRAKKAAAAGVATTEAKPE